jgi:hypothetical protein
MKLARVIERYYGTHALHSFHCRGCQLWETKAAEPQEGA